MKLESALNYLEIALNWVNGEAGCVNYPFAMTQIGYAILELGYADPEIGYWLVKEDLYQMTSALVDGNHTSDKEIKFFIDSLKNAINRVQKEIASEY